MSFLIVIFGRRSSLLFCQMGNIIFVGRRNSIFTRMYRKYHISMYIFEKDDPSFSVWRIGSYFWGKQISILLIIQEWSYSSAFFWKNHLFKTSRISCCASLVFARFIFAPLIFAQLNNSYICAGIIFTHWQNLHFCVDLSCGWKY